MAVPEGARMRVASDEQDIFRILKARNFPIDRAAQHDFPAGAELRGIVREDMTGIRVDVRLEGIGLHSKILRRNIALSHSIFSAGKEKRMALEARKVDQGLVARSDCRAFISCTV